MPGQCSGLVRAAAPLLVVLDALIAGRIELSCFLGADVYR
jgi:hypothetical protein